MRCRRDSIGLDGPEKDNDKWRKRGGVVTGTRQIGIRCVMIPAQRSATRYEESEG